jgi:hypothetical protein
VVFNWPSVPGGIAVVSIWPAWAAAVSAKVNTAADEYNLLFS